MSIKPLEISFEFFPPKTDEGNQSLLKAATELMHWQPEFFSVTFGAGGSTRMGTLQTVDTLQQQTGMVVAPHISCIGFNRHEILETLDNYRQLDIKRLVVLRGDCPSGMGNAGEYRYASELVELVREVTGDYFHISVAAYPEIHPEAISAHDDVLNLQRKYQAGANAAITQFFFNADAYFYYLDKCSEYGINLPIIPGIMPITQYHRLARFAEMCGAEIPRWLGRRLEAYGDDIEAIKAFGVEVVSNLCERLIAGGAQGLHFYTLNKSETTSKIINNLGLDREKKDFFVHVI